MALGAALLAVTLAAHAPLFHAGMWVSDEELHWLRRLSEFDHTLRQGQRWPRWFANLEWGHGYPYPNFYAPGGLWLGWLCLLITSSYLWGVKGAFLLAGALAPLGMYRLLRPGVSRPAALIGALLYLLAPYHLLNIYVRGNLAEYLAMGVFPWALWGLLRMLRRGDAKSFCLSCFLLAAYQLTHTLSALFGTTMLLVITCGLSFVMGGGWISVTRIFAAVGVGTLLSSVYWLPALWDSQFVRVADVAQTIVAADHVVYPIQLLNPMWGWGYSVPGPSDEISFQLGIPHVLGLVVGVWLAFTKTPKSLEIKFWVFICLSILLATLPVSAPLWSLPIVRMIQFPWRLLAWAAVATSVIGALCVDSLGLSWTRLSAWFVLVLCLTQFLYVKAEFYRDVGEADFTPRATRGLIRGNTTDDEYLPRWVQERPRTRASRVLEGRRAPVEVKGGGGTEFDRWFEIVVPVENTILWPVYHYPNWQIEVDGRRVPIQVERDGTVAFPVAAGTHTVRIRWVDTPVHALATLLSLATLLGLLAALIWPRRRGEGIVPPAAG